MCVHAPSDLLVRLVTRKPTAVASAIARTTERALITTSVNATTAGRESAAISTRAKPSATAAITARASAWTNASARTVGEDQAARFRRALKPEIARETAIALHRIVALVPEDFPASTVRRRPIVRNWTIALETVSVLLRTGRNTVRATRVTKGRTAAWRRAPVRAIALATELASKSICVIASTATRVLTAASFLVKQRSFVQVRLMLSFCWIYYISFVFRPWKVSCSRYVHVRFQMEGTGVQHTRLLSGEQLRQCIYGSVHRARYLSMHCRLRWTSL